MLWFCDLHKYRKCVMFKRFIVIDVVLYIYMYMFISDWLVFVLISLEYSAHIHYPMGYVQLWQINQTSRTSYEYTKSVTPWLGAFHMSINIRRSVLYPIRPSEILATSKSWNTALVMLCNNGRFMLFAKIDTLYKNLNTGYLLYV